MAVLINNFFTATIHLRPFLPFRLFAFLRKLSHHQTCSTPQLPQNQSSAQLEGACSTRVPPRSRVTRVRTIITVVHHSELTKVAQWWRWLWRSVLKRNRISNAFFIRSLQRRTFSATDNDNNDGFLQSGAPKANNKAN